MVPNVCPGGGMVDTGDLKSPGHCDRAGSSPAPGTISFQFISLKFCLTAQGFY